MENYADKSKWKLKTFNLEQAKRGEIVCTEKGILVKDLVFDENTISGTIEGMGRYWWHLDGQSNSNKSINLFHPVLIKTKRIPFDLEKYKAGAKVVCRGEDYEFRGLLASDLDSDCPLVLRAYRKSSRREVIKQLTYDGLSTPVEEYDSDILLEVADNSPTVHELKIWPEHYEAVDSGKKRFEIRNHDRNFHLGDILELRYYDAETGQYDEKKPVIKAEVIYLLNGGQFGIEPGYVAIGFNRIFPQ